MVSCVVLYQPPSQNGGEKENKKAKYQKVLVHSLERFCRGAVPMLTEELYGIVYYFHRKPTGTDADNISKLLWDSLNTVLFGDDKQIKLRIAGVIPHQQINVIDTTYMAGPVADALIEAILEGQDHVIYMECGKLNDDLFTVNLEKL
jgi:hypothetical protein